MGDQSLRIYPRGFLGANVQPQGERTPKPFNHELKQHQYFANDFRDRQTSSISPNTYVEALYSAYIKQTANSGSFEFHKKILITALTAFGTDRFDLWFNAQQQSPAASDLHGRFLDDTLHFISEGKRNMSLENWAALIVITDEGNNINTSSEFAKEFFGLSSGGYNRRPQNNDLTEVIQMWCSKANGIEDMLGTLHILFGNV